MVQQKLFRVAKTYSQAHAFSVHGEYFVYSSFAMFWHHPARLFSSGSHQHFIDYCM